MAAAPENHLSTNSELSAIRGHTEPRLWTPPLRKLTPETSEGYDQIEFAKHIGRPLDPWQEWTVIHAGELLPDGRPRFRRILILVARQNGKTELLVVLSLFWLFVMKVGMVLGTSTKLEYAAESWKKSIKLARRVPWLSEEIPKRGGIKRVNGGQELWRADEEEYELDEGSRYKIAPSNEEGGRSLTIDRLVLDELRHHHSYEAYDASEPATTAAPDGGQVWSITNAGSDKSVVLNDMREEALEFIKTGKGDYRLGLFEYSAHEKAAPNDIEALRHSNPNLGIRKNAEDLLAAGAAAMAKGGAKLAGFKTEQMCIHVPRMDPALDMENWKRPADEGGCYEVATLDGRKLAFVFEVSLDGKHITLCAAAPVEDGKVRVEVVQAWDNLADMKREIRQLVRRNRPATLSWIANGPAAAVSIDLKEKKGWPPPGTKLEPITSEITDVCMGYGEMIEAGDVLQSGDELLTTQSEGAEKAWRSDRWVFTRHGTGHVDAVYAAAGAVHKARDLPVAIGKPRVLVARPKESE